MTWTKQLIRYKKLIKSENYFREIVLLIKECLSVKQLSKLILHHRGETYDLWEQILLRFIDNRYSLIFKKTEAFGRVGIFLEKYKFLLNSNFDNERVRHIFMRALMEVVSIGSGMFWSSRDVYLLHQGNEGNKYGCERTKLFRLWCIFSKHFRNTCKAIGRRYPNIPTLRIPWYYVWERYQKWQSEAEYHFTYQLRISYAYAFRKLLKKKKITVDGFGQEFLRRARWYLECLNQCNVIFVNKYKERVIRELSSALGMDEDRAHLVHFSFLKDLENKQYGNKNDLSEFISSLFTDEELKLLELRDSRGNVWSFQKQIKNRYHSKYPSFVSVWEIEENVRKKVVEFRPLLNAETVEVIKDTFLDEIERECFVSRTTYLWNQEMENNLKNNGWKCGGKVAKAIDLLLSLLPADSAKQLSLEINGRIFNLKEQLMSRWSRAWFGASLKDFQEYLLKMHLHTPYNFESWRNMKKVCRTNLQAFLEEIDMFFLYPQRWRIIKKLCLRLDNGRVVNTFKNMERVCWSQMYGELFCAVAFKRTCILGLFALLGTSLICGYASNWELA